MKQLKKLKPKTTLKNHLIHSEEQINRIWVSALKLASDFNLIDKSLVVFRKKVAFLTHIFWKVQRYLGCSQFVLLKMTAYFVFFDFFEIIFVTQTKSHIDVLSSFAQQIFSFFMKLSNIRLKKLNSRVTRWLIQFKAYDFKVPYLTGALNLQIALSRCHGLFGAVFLSTVTANDPDNTQCNKCSPSITPRQIFIKIHYSRLRTSSIANFAC